MCEYPELGMEAIWKIDVVDFPRLFCGRQRQRFLQTVEAKVFGCK